VARVELPFEPERQYSASVREHAGQTLLFVKGAPERLLAMSRHLLTDAGPVALDPATVQQAAQALASRGLRVLGMAYRVLPLPSPRTLELPEPDDLVFLGLQGMLDPPRAGVREAIAGCQESGIRVVMIAGDHAATARAIGRELGIASEDAPVMTGAEWRSSTMTPCASAWAPSRSTRGWRRSRSCGSCRRCAPAARWWPSPATASTTRRR
jgi:Ca2+-transporting ATPase